MKNILRQLAISLGLFLLIYSAVFALALATNWRGDALDTRRAKQTWYMDDITYLMFDRHVLSSNSPKLVLAGASNVANSFRPEELQKYSNGYEIHNISIVSSYARKIGQSLDMALEVMPPETVKKSVFIIGTWYGFFATDKNRQDFITDKQRKWSLLYHKGKTGYELAIAPRYLGAVDTALTPFFYLEKEYSLLKGIMFDLSRIPQDMRLHKKPNFVLVADIAAENRFHDNYRITEDEKNDAIAIMNNKFRSNQDLVNQYPLLVDMVDKITRKGGRVVVVDLPIPKWHAERSIRFKTYQKTKHIFIDEITSKKGAYYFDMQNMGDDEVFSDYIHPRPKYTYLWSKKLGLSMKDLLKHRK